MYLQGKYFYDILPEDIENLFTYQVKESKTLDYKKIISVFGKNTEKERTEFFRDITAMYNTAGGIIIYGISERKDRLKSGYPDKYHSQEIQDEDKVSRQIQGMVRSNTDPQITNLAVRYIEVKGNNLLLIGIPKGIGLPVMVISEEINTFYRRNGTEKYGVMTSELNQMFLLNQTTREKADTFRKSRIKDVRGGLYPKVKLEGAFYLHTIPYDFLEEGTYPINRLPSTLSNAELVQSLERSNHTTDNIQYNADGLFTYVGKHNEPLITAYNQYFRNGIIEVYSADCFLTDNNRSYFSGGTMFHTIWPSLLNIIKVYKIFQIEPPVLIYLTLTDVINAKFQRPSSTPGSQVLGNQFTRLNVTVPPILLTSYDLTKEELFNTLKPALDIVWQSANEPECDSIKLFFPKSDMSEKV